MNLFIIVDIEAFGYDSDFQEVWGYFGEEHDLEAILLRFHNSFIPYAKTGTVPVKEIGGILKSWKDKVFISGIVKLRHAQYGRCGPDHRIKIWN